MKRRYLMIVSLLVLTIVMVGCGATAENQKVVGPARSYEAKVAAINRQAKAIKQAHSVPEQVAALKKLEHAAADYYRRKQKSQQVTLVYQNTVKDIKQLIQTENLQRLKRQSPAKLDQETSTDLARKNTALKDLKAELVSQEGVVYTAPALKRLIVRIDKQLLKNQAQAKAHGEGQRKSVVGKSAKTATGVQTMNLHQIKAGDYTSLMGSWKEVGEGFNASDGKGPRWSKPSGRKLTVSKTSLRDGSIALRTARNGRTTLTEDDTSGKTVEKPGKIIFQEGDDLIRGDVLELSGNVGVNCWSIDFLPKGSSIKDWPANISPSKEHIEMGHPHFWEVFERE
ncbi:MAG: DUF6287 domain-containing protein [Levilactobacillus sp.]|uniref:DUF6287 domain-containing protein n=1 Tax=Levilactobacillus sp. TaxID=2767919 RepID=UPI00258B8858|nr:DUF6287 domain-containing protein [Levilactobacillus sp.]MCH4124030.1 DUF6287 domain-containing protein [Levilactobacillus sp.]MCI1554134.1 DUF6287 domain-containing protein [Levilactobacillus sp.]MCI1599338.1 DUF6287 domain-containing protein [Levilactobacillus sp.]MCI1605722.1 DUF6287 domain-containing protein [Levilactobacillus sp.]